MNRIHLFLITMCLTCQSAMAFNHLNYINGLKAPSSNPQENIRVLNVLDACGGINQLDIQCSEDGLKRLVKNEDNALARSILSQYNRTQAEGRVNRDPECRTTEHEETNFILGHCLFIMNFYALRDSSRERGIFKYETCLQGGLIGLAYEGYMSAQFLLNQFFEKRENAQSAEIWKKSLEFKKGSEEDRLLRKCYF